jgi:hypothetical protein
LFVHVAFGSNCGFRESRILSTTAFDTLVGEDELAVPDLRTPHDDPRDTPMISRNSFLPSCLQTLVSANGATHISIYQLTDGFVTIVGEFGLAALELPAKSRQRSNGATREIFDSFEEVSRTRRLVGKHPSDICPKDTAASGLGIVP